MIYNFNNNKNDTPNFGIYNNKYAQNIYSGPF